MNLAMYLLNKQQAKEWLFVSITLLVPERMFTNTVPGHGYQLNSDSQI
jgi:hypothetical protein